MDGLIKIMNELQVVFMATGTKSVDLPQIVVVGAQSSGKSSVLESLVGKSFLPRGSGLVTRCPAVLQLIHTLPKNADFVEEEEWCEFQHIPGKRFTDFDEVRHQIECETNRKAGTNMNIVNDPIFITVYSPNVVNLTVVDLPGIVKVPAGDQPKDIEEQISNLIQEYIKNPNSIILAVSSANNDIHTSESLKYAEKADPNGDRTLAIITKLDLMDKGTDATHVLAGEVLPVKLGIFGVVNRSQQDIKDNKTIENALEDERIFLEKHYPTLASRNGTPYLAYKLNGMLMEHIGKCLPDLEIRINKLLTIYQAKLDALGGRGLPKDKNAIMIQLIGQFCEAYKAAIVGDNRKLERKSLCGGARIRQICQTRIDKLLGELENCEITDEEIKNAIQNSKGYEASLDSQDAFQSLVKDQILEMKKPLLSCATKVHVELKTIVQSCISDDIRRYPKFHHSIISIVNDMWNRAFKELKDELEKYIEIEAAHVNTDHEDFKKQAMEKSISDNYRQERAKMAKDKATPVVQNGFNPSASAGFVLQPPSLIFGNAANVVDTSSHPAVHLPQKRSYTEQLQDSCDTAKYLIKIYFRIVLKNTKDHFRKSLAYHMIYYAMDKLNAALTTKMFPGQVEELIQESEHHVKAREEALTMIEALERATEIIEKTRSIVSS